MSVQINELPNRKGIEIKATAKLCRKDYEQFVPVLENLLKESGDQVSILFDMDDFHGWNLGAAWEDTKLGLRHYGDFSKIALVGEKKWQKGIATLAKPFTKAKVRYYDRSEATKAKLWVRNGH